MKKPTANLTESPFDFNELFFSVTDKRGVIRFGNDVFVRVSVYPKETLLNAPHSIVRHPDMPASVFKIFWDTLKKDKPICAYVKNMAGNGNYYWVFALAFPLNDGYLSIRFKPSSALFKSVQDIYSEVSNFEKTQDDLETSEKLLMNLISKAGFSDYESFMIHAAVEELNSREIQAKQLRALAANTSSLADRREGRSELSQITQITDAASAQLNDFFMRVKGFQNSNRTFTQTMETLGDGFHQLKFISLNMTIAAAKFGDVASSLGVVSKEFSSVSDQIEDHLSGLSEFIKTLAQAIQKCTLQIAALNAQMLMVDFFVKESIAKLQTSENAFAEMAENRENFSNLFRKYASDLSKEASSLLASLSDISYEVSEVHKFVTGLEVVRQIGAVESARTDEIKGAFIHYLEAMNKFIQLLRNSTSTIHHEVVSLQENSEVIVSSVNTLSSSVEAIFGLASAFGQKEELPKVANN
ncbi:PAS domain-containing protein [Bdellovibrio svalbardensis]|uniref:PAS domain-containing protein n=1 Tax=Bdellovibrio svalbardensis TaxID=2972972 RepID=A0ABT6DLX6_9BACT|nr:PAS domain-containing protein [Bdellovibrio svalbardensis]MDG0817875.1 PAS domain-containing protein [Bdellovibrio svalbardensis]